MKIEPRRLTCDTFDCDAPATHRADWPLPTDLHGKGFGGGGVYCDDCADLLRSSSNVVPL
jgi:hypothetical protein